MRAERVNRKWMEYIGSSTRNYTNRPRYLFAITLLYNPIQSTCVHQTRTINGKSEMEKHQWFSECDLSGILMYLTCRNESWNELLNVLKASPSFYPLLKCVLFNHTFFHQRNDKCQDL